MATVKHVVVDSGAFIRNAPIKDIAQNVYSISDVVSEIKDKPTRQRLQVLPYVIKFEEPNNESIRIVTEFTKKTGDYRSLSATDIRVLALTYQLEKRHVGVDHIRTVPDRKIVFETGTTASLSTEIAGFYVKKDVSSGQASVEPSSTPSGDDSKELGSSGTAESAVEGDVSDRLAQVELQGTDEAQSTDTGVRSNALEDGDTLHEVTECTSSEEEEESESEEDDDGWITPGNVDAVNKAMTGVSSVETNPECTVGCLTTDFAMQNVLIHMGLNVISVDGMLIKKAKSYVLRCYSCFKISMDLTRQFCHHCGNRTLRRLTVAINDDGTMQYFLSKKQFKIRKQPSIPLPKGGKFSHYPKLTEDQQLPQQRKAKQKHQHYGVFDVDYISNGSPFSIRDTTSRSAHVGAGRNFNKRNPNGDVRRRKK